MLREANFVRVIRVRLVAVNRLGSIRILGRRSHIIPTKAVIRDSALRWRPCYWRPDRA